MLFDQIYENNKTKYLKLITQFQNENFKINLSSFNDNESIINKHIKDSLEIFNFDSWKELYQSNKKVSIADIGSGGGFPGIALAIAIPHAEFTLIESIGKKCKAMENMISILSLNNVKVLNKRAEEVNEKFDFTISRAVAEFEKIFLWSKSITTERGKIYLYKSKKENIQEFNDKIIYKVGDDERVIYEFIN